MFYRSTELTGRTVAAVDGDIGTVEDVYFDDERWGVRYFVVNTGGWLNGRRVLVSPLAIVPGELPNDRIPVRLTRQQVKDSPPVDTDQPVSRHYEQAYADYYGNAYYWAGPHLWGIGGYASMLDVQPIPPGPADRELRALAEAEQAAAEATHLRSCREVRGYRIAAADGDIGHVSDFLVDGETWGIAQLIVDKRNWLPAGQVLVPPAAVGHIDWNTRSLRLEMTREEIRSSPPYER